MAHFPSEILVGTGNANKRDSIASFCPAGIRFLLPGELGIQVHISETGHTPLENAKIKALAYHAASGLPVISDDSAFYFLDIPMDDPCQPGLTVRRKKEGEEELNDDEMIAYYGAIAKAHGGRIRVAYQNGRCVIAKNGKVSLHQDSRQVMETSSFYLVDIPHEKRHVGWPLDSLSVEPITGQYYMDLTETGKRAAAAEKNAFHQSHRLELEAFYANALLAMD